MGPKSITSVVVRPVLYSGEVLEEEIATDLTNLKARIPESGVLWVHCDGIHDLATIEGIGKTFGLHPLVLEDIVNSTQRPKREVYDGYLFVVARTMRQAKSGDGFVLEQVSFVVGKNFLISFEEGGEPVFDGVMRRIREGRNRIRTQGSDYLLYALLDSIVDSYFFVIEKFGDEIDNFEEAMIENPGNISLQNIYGLKRSILHVRRAIWPLREVISALERDDTGLVGKSTTVFLRDVYDHSVEIIDVIENLREMSSGLLEVYLSSVSNRLNEVMKFLTVFSAIFMPLSFIAGVYGMNFERMPELSWRYGYPFSLGLMALTALFLLGVFRRKNWL